MHVSALHQCTSVGRIGVRVHPGIYQGRKRSLEQAARLRSPFDASTVLIWVRDSDVFIMVVEIPGEPLGLSGKTLTILSLVLPFGFSGAPRYASRGYFAVQCFEAEVLCF